MSNPSLTYEKLVQINEALHRVIRRASNIRSEQDFLSSDHGLDMLDSIGMMLIAIGENLKKIDYETDGALLKQYPSVDWKGAKGMRDILSHHYFDLDAGEVFTICKRDIPALSSVIKTMISDLAEEE